MVGRCTFRQNGAKKMCDTAAVEWCWWTAWVTSSARCAARPPTTPLRIGMPGREVAEIITKALKEHFVTLEDQQEQSE